MPLLDIECPSHGLQETFVKRLPASPLVCPLCNREAKRVWTLHSMAHTVEFTAGYDRMLWRNFDSKKERDDYLRKENLTKIG